MLPVKYIYAQLDLLLLLLLLQGADGWAPIMGLGYYQPISQWSKGEFSGANNPQDDLAVIASKLKYAPVGNGPTISTATIVTPRIWPNGTANVSALGLVSQSNALDVFHLQAGIGMISFAVTGVAAYDSYTRTNLKAAARILNAAGAEVPSTQNTAGPGVSGTAWLSTAGKLLLYVIFTARLCRF
jgi:hypothetical protein